MRLLRSSSTTKTWAFPPESGVKLVDMLCPRVGLYRCRRIWNYELRDLSAWSSLDPHDTSRGWGDPDAFVGQGQEGFILGYRSLFLIDVKGYPLGRARGAIFTKIMKKRGIDLVLGYCVIP